MSTSLTGLLTELEYAKNKVKFYSDNTMNDSLWEKEKMFWEVRVMDLERRIEESSKVLEG